MSTATITETGTFEGRTAAEWREMAADSARRSFESFERCDTDGFLSQWALDSSAEGYRMRAQLAETGGTTRARALFDLDGNLIPSVHGWGQYGEYFAVLDNEERGWSRFVKPSQARSEETERKNNAAKGFYVGYVTTAAKVVMIGSGTGLSGCASARNAIVPQTYSTDKDTTLITAEQVVEIIDNGHEVEAAPAAAEIVAALAKAATTARTETAQDTLTEAAGKVAAGQYDEARAILAPLRTRASRAAIAAIKAL
jgi:hypothetical protein